MLFQRCCNPMGDDVLAKSFMNSPLSDSNRSRVSKEVYFGFRDKEITFIKKYSKENWNKYDEEDDVESVYSSINSSRKSSAYSDCYKRHPNTPVSVSKAENCSNLSKLSSRKDSANSSVYFSKSPEKSKSTSSKVLDWITMCFWKCSPGCQQLPTLQI